MREARAEKRRRECHLDETICFRSYAGTVERLILVRGDTESEMACKLEEASVLRVKGHWDLIRAFGRFRPSPDEDYEGELCVVENWQTEAYAGPREK